MQESRGVIQKDLKMENTKISSIISVFCVFFFFELFMDVGHLTGFLTPVTLILQYNQV